MAISKLLLSLANGVPRHRKKFLITLLGGLLAAYYYNRKNIKLQGECPEKRNEIKPKESAKVGVNLAFIQQLKKIIPICIPGLASKEFGLLVGLAMILIVRTGLDIWFTSFNGSVVRSIVTRDWRMFTKNAVYIFGFMMWPMSIVNNSIKLIISTLALSFRARLTTYAHEQYLKDITFYKVSNLDNRIRNIDQLITQDIVKFSESLSHLYSDIAKPLVDIGLFALKLGQSIGSEAPLAMLTYFIASGAILRSISPPFGRFAAKEQSLEGEFRHGHSRLIGHSEEIAFYGGADREKEIVNGNFQKIVDHSSRVYFLRFGNGIIDSVLVKYCATQLAYYLLSRPVFGASQTSINRYENDPTLIMEAYSKNSGYLINLSQAVGRLVLAGRDLTRFAGYTWRVAELFNVLEDLSLHHRYQRTMISGDGGVGGISEVKTISEDELKGKVIETTENEEPFIEFERVPIATPNGDVLLSEMSFRVNRGMNCMITGPNGCGKSSLFRILGSLWPLFGGKLTKPPLAEIFYVPQKPYLPLGTLRDQIIYPQSSLKECENCSDAELLDLLKIVHLEYLVEREGGWEAIRDWQDVLSGGEKQRIAMARLFHHRPAFAILDECTSAVSIDVEGLMYRHAQEVLKITLFTVSHRPSLVPFHDYLLKFDGQGGYEFTTINHTDNEEETRPEINFSRNLSFKNKKNRNKEKHKTHMKHVSIDTSLLRPTTPDLISSPSPVLSISQESLLSSPYMSSYNSVSTPHLLYSYPRSPYSEDKDGGVQDKASDIK